MKIKLTDLGEFVEEANKLSKDRTELERSMFVTTITRDETGSGSASTIQHRSVTASFATAAGAPSSPTG